MHQCSEVRALHTLPLCVVWRGEPPNDKKEDSCTHTHTHASQSHTQPSPQSRCSALPVQWWFSMAVELHTGAKPVGLSSILRSRVCLRSSPLHVRFSSCLSVCLLSICLCPCVSLSLSHTHILYFSHGAAHIHPLTQKPGRASEREGEREQGKLEEEEIKG